MKPLSLLRHGHGDGRPPDWASRENFLSRLSSHVSRLLRIPHDPHPPSPTLDQTGLFTEAHRHPTSTESPPSWWKWKWEWKKPGPRSCPTLLWLTEVQPPSSWGACSPRPRPRHITSRPPQTDHMEGMAWGGGSSSSSSGITTRQNNLFQRSEQRYTNAAPTDAARRNLRRAPVPGKRRVVCNMTPTNLSLGIPSISRVGLCSTSRGISARARA